MRHWDYPDFVGRSVGWRCISSDEIGLLEAPLEPWKLMMAISAVTLTRQLFAFVFQYEISQ